MKFNTKAAVKHSLGLSDEHIKELNQEVDDYKFTDLTLQQDVIEETQTDLQKDITASKYFIESASQRSEEYNFGGAILKAGAILLNYTDSLYEYTYSYCEDELLPYTSYRDSTLNGVIQTSWQTIKNSNNQFIIAHEIAHNIYKYLTQTVLPNDKSFIFIQQMAQTYTDVYDYMRSKKYGHDLYCVAEWGQDFNSNANILQQITHEEDWADYFGAEILSKGGFLKKDKNQVCEKFAHDPEQIDELHLVSPTSGDTHSSWLLRLLRFEYKMKESLPSSCQEELEDSPFIESFSSCN